MTYVTFTLIPVLTFTIVYLSKMKVKQKTDVFKFAYMGKFR